MKSVNKVTLIGNVGKDPEMRYTTSGEAIASFSLATSDRWKNKAGEAIERTEWHRIETFGELAKVARDYVKKGQPVYLEGAIKYEEFIDKEGVKRNITKIVLGKYNSTMVLLGTKPKPAQEEIPEMSEATEGP